MFLSTCEVTKACVNALLWIFFYFSGLASAKKLIKSQAQGCTGLSTSAAGCTLRTVT